MKILREESFTDSRGGEHLIQEFGHTKSVPFIGGSGQMHVPEAYHVNGKRWGGSDDYGLGDPFTIIKSEIEDRIKG